MHIHVDQMAAVQIRELGPIQQQKYGPRSSCGSAGAASAPGRDAGGENDTDCINAKQAARRLEVLGELHKHVGVGGARGGVFDVPGPGRSGTIRVTGETSTHTE